MNRVQELVQRISRQPPFPLAIQSDETECGLASLTMVLRALGSTCELERLRVLYGSTRGGMTVGELCEFAATVGLRGIPARMELEKLEKTPSIIFARNEHFSVLWRIEEDAKHGKTYHIADPSDGILCFGEADISEYYSGLQITFRPIKRVFENQDLTQPGHVPQKLSALLISKTVIVLLICILASASAVLALLNAGAQDVFMTYVGTPEKDFRASSSNSRQEPRDFEPLIHADTGEVRFHKEGLRIPLDTLSDAQNPSKL